MNDVAQMWIQTNPKPVQKKSSSLVSSTTFFVLLFICLIMIAIPTLYLLPKVNTANQGSVASDSVDVPELLSNCAFFYQLCSVSSQGRVTLQSVDTLLTALNSPLQQSGLLLYSQTNNEQSSLATPSQIVTLIGNTTNLNPFLLLTLSEINSGTVTKPINLKPTIEAGGEDSGSAWFSIQHQFLAQELQKNATEAQLAPNTLKETSHLKIVKIGSQQITVHGNFSLATQVVLEYLAAHSTSTQELQTKLSTFSETYQKLWGIDPSQVETK